MNASVSLRCVFFLSPFLACLVLKQCCIRVKYVLYLECSFFSCEVNLDIRFLGYDIQIKFKRFFYTSVVPDPYFSQLSDRILSRLFYFVFHEDSLWQSKSQTDEIFFQDILVELSDAESNSSNHLAHSDRQSFLSTAGSARIRQSFKSNWRNSFRCPHRASRCSVMTATFAANIY